MDGTIRDEIRAENIHRTNEINARNLEQYHQMLNAFNTQATLIVGFSVAMINHDNLNAIANEGSKYCMYRRDGRAVFAFIFGASTVACLSISFTCFFSSFYSTVRSQQYALHIGVKESVAMVRTWARVILVVYAFGLLCFLVSALSLIWIFAGGSNYETVDEAALLGGSGGGGSGGELPSDLSEVAVRLDTGALVIPCLDPRLAASHERQAHVSRLFAGITTGTFVFTLLLGGAFLLSLQRDFRIVAEHIVRLQGRARLEANERRFANPHASVVYAAPPRAQEDVAGESSQRRARGTAAKSTSKRIRLRGTVKSLKLRNLTKGMTYKSSRGGGWRSIVKGLTSSSNRASGAGGDESRARETCSVGAGGASLAVQASNTTKVRFMTS